MRHTAGFLLVPPLGLITLAICVLTGEAIILERMYILSGSDILSICLTSLFALPSVRSVLPGAPPFGCLLDMVGILPNIILISLCVSTFLLLAASGNLNVWCAFQTTCIRGVQGKEPHYFSHLRNGSTSICVPRCFLFLSNQGVRH
jgi:hypothetical protein